MQLTRIEIPLGATITKALSSIPKPEDIDLVLDRVVYDNISQVLIIDIAHRPEQPKDKVS